MNPHLEVKLRAEVLRHGNAIDALANEAVRRCARDFAAKYPKRKLEIIFGMGGESIIIDGDTLYTFWNPSSESVVWEPGTCQGKIIPAAWDCEWRNCKLRPESVAMFLVMLDDVNEITDGYSRGCPNNVKPLKTQQTVARDE